MCNVFTGQAMLGGDEEEWYILEIQGTLTFLLFLIESYKENIITQNELVQALIQFLNNQESMQNE